MAITRFVLLVLMLAPALQVGVARSETEALSAEVRFFYEDLERARAFYREHLGLIPIETREDAVVLEIAPGALLTLATLESGGYAPDTPRTAAIALVTDQLDAWWDALSGRGLTMRTTSFEPRPGSAHDGFVLEDPEGWYLEFERFNPHPENERFMPRLDALPTRAVDAAAAGLPEGL
ncbi:MAG: VOC family protein, partial [Halieaceae bacterium]|nr:VOC family protein [Halieaceae bacterium]